MAVKLNRWVVPAVGFVVGYAIGWLIMNWLWP